MVGTFAQKRSRVGGGTAEVSLLKRRENFNNPTEGTFILSLSKERVESTWRVFRLRENTGRIPALKSTNRRNLTQQQILEPHTWRCGGLDLNTAPCRSRMTLFWPAVS